MFPLKMTPLDSVGLDNFDKRFERPARTVREGVWRRHQCEDNKELSGWRSWSDQRRRMIHYRDRYAVENGHFVLQKPYLYLNVRNTRDEIEKYVLRMFEATRGWKHRGKNEDFDGNTYSKDELLLMWRTGPVFVGGDLFDVEIGWDNPDYTNFELFIHTGLIHPAIFARPWEILRTGIREMVPRGNPQYGTIEDIREYLPAHVELGCGPSIEAGVLPLNSLHSIYSIANDGKFLFEAEHDRVFEFVSRPEEKWREAALIHETCVLAPVTQFYHDLKSLLDRGDFLGPLITNNFDGIPFSLGLKEYSLRAFDNHGVYPGVPLDSAAKSLIVIGSHADRRGAQRCARKAGLKIIFIDTEGYQTEDGFKSYPLEAPQDEDIVIKMSAAEALRGLHG